MTEDKFIIKLNKIDVLYEFVNDAKTINNTIKAQQGLYTVDAKSLMGLFSLDLTKDVEIVICGDVGLGDLYKLRKYIGKGE